MNWIDFSGSEIGGAVVELGSGVGGWGGAIDSWRDSVYMDLVLVLFRVYCQRLSGMARIWCLQRAYYAVEFQPQYYVDAVVLLNESMMCHEGILELGFGKAIEEILDFLGSRQNDPESKESIVPKAAKFTRQNLLLSATLNERVNHLANTILENSVMIRMDGKTISSEKPSQPVRRFASSDSDEDNSDEDSVLVNTLPSHLTESYNLPAQLVQKYVKVSCGSRLVSLLSIPCCSSPNSQIPDPSPARSSFPS